MSADNKLLEGLNKEQEKAIKHTSGPLLIIAGAGTGKTTVITRKIAYLIEQKLAKPEEILALTFTDKAAAEMEERVDKLLPYGYIDVRVSTFHAFCERVLRDHGLDIGLPADFKLLDQTEQWLLVRQNLDKFDLDYYKPLGNPTKFVHALIKHFSRAKDEDITPQQYMKYAEERQLNLDSPEFIGAKDEEEQEVKRLLEIAHAYLVYQRLLYENGCLDFGDLIVETLHLFKKRPNILKRFREKIKYVLVDEFQDTNFSQYELVKLLAEPLNNLTVVADDDQSIYKFRGASYSNILKFQQDYPKAETIFLTQNYRSAQNILDLSYQFIQNNNPDRLEARLSSGKKTLSKKLKSQVQEQGIIEHLRFADQHEEAEGVVHKILQLMKDDKNLTYNDFAILARSHDTLIPFVDVLEEAEVPFIYFANKGLYRKPLILDLLSYFKLLDNYHESQSVYRVLNLPVFAISHRAIVDISYLARKKSLSLFEALKKAGSLDGVTADDLAGINKLLSLVDKHSRLAREKSVHQLFVQVFNDLEIHKIIGFDSLEQIQNARLVESFDNKIKNFCAISADKSLRAFLSQINLEQEAGEQGSLETDLEAGPEAVKLMTVHGAKGLEFAYVFVVGLVDKRFPTIERSEPIEMPKDLVKDILPEGDVHLQEERRLLYVAMTRAKKGLYLTRALDYGGKLTKRPSRFLIELGLAEEEKARPTGETDFKPAMPAISLPLPSSFSFSQISTFKKCPLEYKYRYILGIPTPGSASLSFGQSIHKTFEKYLWMYQKGRESIDLFGEKKENNLPPFEALKKIYEDSWIDDWYDNKADMEKMKQRGLEFIKIFFEECQTNKPNPKYLEQPFKLKVEQYNFQGKIDRADSTPSGLIIIDYKTGESRTKIEKVDKDQLMIYQWAAESYFKEKVADLQYWFFDSNAIKKQSFLAKQEEISDLQKELLATIEEIVKCVKDNSFYQADIRQSSHDCQYRHFEKDTKVRPLLVAAAKKSLPATKKRASA